MATEYIKFGILLSLIGSTIAATNFNPNDKTTKLTIGAMMVNKNNKSPTPPTAFFINILLANIKLKPSDKYPPKIGMYVFNANFAVLIEIPSIEDAVSPLIAIIAKNIVKMRKKFIKFI